MIKKHADAIGHALEGLHWALVSQSNYRVHILLVLCSLFAGVLLRISYYEWLIIFVLIVLGLVIETVNTAIEQLGDAISTDFNVYIKRAKDVSAAAMLLYAIGSASIAGIIFIPRITTLLF